MKFIFIILKNLTTKKAMFWLQKVLSGLKGSENVGILNFEYEDFKIIFKEEMYVCEK